MVLLPAVVAIACAGPPPAPPPPRPVPLLPGLEPASPPGTEGLHASPCTRRLDLSPSPADDRAFGAGSRSLTGRTSLSYRAPARAHRAPGGLGVEPAESAEPPSWTGLSWSSSRPGALRFEEEGPFAVSLVAGEAGATLVRLSLEDPVEGADAVTALVSVPLFVRVRADADFAPLLDRELGLAGREREVLAEAKRALDAIYARVNLRVAFEVGLGESLPAEIPPGTFIEATLHGSLRSCVTPRSSLLSTEFGGYAEGDSGRRLLAAPVHVCPAIFTRHPDTLAEMVKRRARLLAAPPGAAFFVAAVGRALGELIAHEIGHQLLGCDLRGARRFSRCHDRLPRSLMNKAGERSFTDRTGLVVLPTPYASIWRDDLPTPGTWEDHGVEAINRLPADGQAVLDRILPVPPALGEEPSCAFEPADRP
jgi:hypothetical protein